MAAVSHRRRVIGRIAAGLVAGPLWLFAAYIVANDKSWPRSSLYVSGGFAVVSILVAALSLRELRTLPRE